jgi:purine-binding chemotaxis protein CheW
MNENGLMKEIRGAEQEKGAEEEILTSGNIIQLVSFYVNDMEYGVDILDVHDILRMPEITRLPNTPPFIRGVINLRGNVIPVVDARKRFGFKNVKLTDLTRIIVIESSEKLVGLMVDSVHQVVRIPEEFVDPPSSMIEGVSDEYLKGIGRLRDRLIIILNIDNILFDDEDLKKE